MLSVTRSVARDDIREGWRWLLADPAVRTLAITIFTFNVPMLPPPARDHGPAGSSMWLVSAAETAPLLIMRVQRFLPR
jgi:hypothetical protein